MSEQPKKCKIKDCKRPYRAKGYCNVHYKKWRQGEFGKTRYKICGNEGCHKKLHRFGMCAEHFEAWIKSKKEAPAAAAPVVTPAAEVPPAVQGPPAAEAPSA